MNNSFIYDTYAIIEIISGNIKYNNYLDKKIIINNFIYAELCFILIKNNYPNLEEYLNRYSKFIAPLNPNIIKEAMKFRVRNKENDLSMTDCISYLMAKEFGIKFLTGDKEFENLENVEFIKK